MQPGRVEPHALDRDVPPVSAAAATRNAADEGSRGPCRRKPSCWNALEHDDRGPVERTGAPEGAEQHARCGRGWCAARRRSSSPSASSAGEQHRALHLGRRRHRARYRTPRSAPPRRDGAMTVVRVDRSTHRAQRRGDAFHRRSGRLGSPASTGRNGADATMPARSRMVVPEFPQSSRGRGSTSLTVPHPRLQGRSGRSGRGLTFHVEP